MSYKNKQDLYANQIQRWIKIKLKAIEHKGGSCIHCGYNKYYGALEFHHVDPKEKDFVWTKLRLKKWSSIINELDRCVLLCSNCHKEEHHKMRSIR